MVEYHPISFRDQATWIVPRIRFVRGENLERWRTGRRPWGVGDDGRIGNLLKKTQCERGDISQTRRICFFQSQMDESKLPEGDQELRTSTLIRDHPIRGESQRDFPGQSEGSPLPPPQDSLPDASEAINDFWSMSGNFIYRHHYKTRVKLDSPREESFPFPTETHWRLQNYSYKFGCPARETHRWLLEYRWVKGFVWSLDRFHSIYSIWRKTSRRIFVVRGETDKTAVNIQARSFMARALDQNGKKCRAEGETWMNGPMKNRNSIMLEDCEDSISLTLRTWSSKKPLRMLARNWKRR